MRKEMEDVRLAEVIQRLKRETGFEPVTLALSKDSCLPILVAQIQAEGPQFSGGSDWED
jgi:hypothetical protein